MAGTEKVKGHAPRLITVPGYHIHPQYDLKHLRYALEMRRARKPKFGLTLAPMVDLFSILVIFLLMNFSTNGEVYFVSKDVELPRASRGRAIENFPLVSLVQDKVFFESDKGAEIGISGALSEANDGQNPQLRAFLRRLKELSRQINPQNSVARINLQADRLAPIENVKRVMKVLSEEGWNGINFVVDPRK